MNEGEFRNANFQLGNMDPSSFMGILFNAMYKADFQNTEKLRAGFPEEMESVIRWKTEESYYDKLRKAFDGGKGIIDGKRIE